MKLRAKPSGIWVVDYVDDSGQRRRVTTGTRDKAVARKRAREIIMGVAAAPEPGKPQSVTDGSDRKLDRTTDAWTMDRLFRKAELEVWNPREVKSQATVKSNLKVLTKLIGHKPVTEMDHDALVELMNALFGLGYAPGTVKRKMDMVGKALTMATKWKDPVTNKPIITGKPAFPQITVKNARERVVTEREEEAIFKAIDVRLEREPTRDWRRFRALVRFLLDTAARLGEALGVRDLDIEERVLPPEREGEPERRVHFVRFRRYRTKNDKPRQVPLTDAIVADLPYLRMVAAPDGRLFPLRAATVWYMWDNIRDDLRADGWNLDDVVLHTFRHTRLTRFAKAGVPIQKISQWAGHSDIKVTWDHYAHLAPEDLISMLDAA